MTEKLGIINSLKQEADERLPNKDWDQAFLEKIKIDFTYNSNKLEGNTITYGQTVKLLRDLVTPKNASTGEVLDMVNHQLVLTMVFKTYHSREITEESIKELHRALMKNREQWSDDGLFNPGQYKDFENMTMRSTGKLHTYMPPPKVSSAMADLIAETNNRIKNADINETARHPLAIATFFHQEFLNKIHPFSDGNGRIGRIFTNLILIKEGYPPIFIHDVDRDTYLKSFELEEKTPGAMLDFFADKMIESLKIKIEFAKKMG